MSSRVVYTSTVTVPIYASWKCEECGEVNFAAGVITCQRRESSSSWRSSKQREAEERAAVRARAEWAGEAFKIISDPNHSAPTMYNGLCLQNTKCTKCGKKPRWNKNESPFTVLCMIVALISGMVAFATLTSIVAWLIFLASAGFFAWGIVQEIVFKKMMPKLPEKYTPVIGSLNEELIAYAEAIGKTIPNPDECIAIVKGYGQVSSHATPKGQPAVKSSASEDSTTIKKYNVCIFDTTTHALRKEIKDINITKFPTSKFAYNDTYYAIETVRDGKKVRIYHTKDNWNKQIEIGISEEDKSTDI